MFWQPELLADVVALVPARGDVDAILRFDPPDWPAAAETLLAEDGAHLLLPTERGLCRLWLPGGLPPRGTPLTALVDLDGYAAERAQAALRFWRAVRSRRSPRPPRRGRKAAGPSARIADHILTLRALDGRLAGASYRAIAEALFGADRVAEVPWKTASLHAKVVRLVAKGRRLMRGGYRELLKPRKRRYRTR